LHPPCAANWRQSSLRSYRDRACFEVRDVYFQLLSYAMQPAVNGFVNAISLSSFLTSPRWPLGGNNFPVSREVLDDLQAGADHMIPHDVVGPLCVRANNSSYDLVVLMKGILRSTRDKLKRLKRCEPLPETTSHRGNTWIMRAQINSLMKFIVHCCEIFVAICNSLLSVCVENLESLLLQRTHSDST